MRSLLAILVLAASAATAANPYLVTDLAPGPADAGIDSPRAAGSTLLFRRAGRDVWRSDGTAAGTFALMTGGTGNLTARSNVVFFTAPAATFPLEDLWSTDGTAAGTTMLDTITGGQSCTVIPGFPSTCTPIPPNPDLLTAARELVFFRESGYALWRSDGTSAGTDRIASYASTVCSFGCLCCFPFGGQLSPLVPVNSRVFFTGSSPVGPLDLTVADHDGTHDVTAVPLLYAMLGVRGRLLIVAGGPDGVTLWRSDGTAAGTVPVVQLGDGTQGASGLTAAGGLLYLVLGTGTAMPGLWRSDGTAAGTFSLLSSDAADLTAVGGRLFFRRLAPGGDELWMSDGSPSGTVLVAPVAPSHPTGLGGTLFFVASDAAGAELWESDGTPTGTAPVADIVPGPDGSDPADLTAACGRLFFTASTPGTGRELWALDVTPGSCTVVDESSCSVDADCDDGDACTADHCDLEAGCSGTLLADLDGVLCVFGDPGSEAALCPGETIPLRITRRLAHARRLVTAALAPRTPRAALLRIRSTLKTLDRAVADVARAVNGGTIGGACGDGLTARTTLTRDRAQVWYAAHGPA